MQQLPLGISQPAEPAFDNFIAGANAEALARVRELAGGTLNERIVYLWGEPGSGRSHLLRAAARTNAALVVADDVERLDASAQQALFIAINDAVVLLPFVPVTAIVVRSGFSANHKFSSEVICTPFLRADWMSWR